jgi:hypothetical protein
LSASRWRADFPGFDGGAGGRFIRIGNQAAGERLRLAQQPALVYIANRLGGEVIGFGTGRIFTLEKGNGPNQNKGQDRDAEGH